MLTERGCRLRPVSWPTVPRRQLDLPAGRINSRCGNSVLSANPVRSFKSWPLTSARLLGPDTVQRRYSAGRKWPDPDGEIVPCDISVISRDEDRFLAFLVPEPSRYAVSAPGMANVLIRPVIEFIEEGTADVRGLRLMSESIRGELIAKWSQIVVSF